jgi:hypothetical protein
MTFRAQPCKQQTLALLLRGKLVFEVTVCAVLKREDGAMTKFHPTFSWLPQLLELPLLLLFQELGIVTPEGCLFAPGF